MLRPVLRRRAAWSLSLRGAGGEVVPGGAGLQASGRQSRGTRGGATPWGRG